MFMDRCGCSPTIVGGAGLESLHVHQGMAPYPAAAGLKRAGHVVYPPPPSTPSESWQQLKMSGFHRAWPGWCAMLPSEMACPCHSSVLAMCMVSVLAARAFWDTLTKFVAEGLSGGCKKSWCREATSAISRVAGSATAGLRTILRARSQGAREFGWLCCHPAGWSCLCGAGCVPNWAKPLPVGFSRRGAIDPCELGDA